MTPASATPSTAPVALSLAGSFALYPVLFRLLNPRNANSLQFVATGKLISTFHSSLVTALALRVLRSSTYWRSITKPPDEPVFEGERWMIDSRSTFANCISAIEAGYLLQDIGVLLLEAKRYGGGDGKGIRALDKTMLAHHVGIGGGLAGCLYYVAQDREKGMYIITMMVLMNASTPLLNLRWFLRTFRRGNRRAIAAVDAAFAATFFLCRIYLLYYIFKLHGAQKGKSALQVIRNLWWPCKTGTSALFLANTAWWALLVRNTLFRRRR